MPQSSENNLLRFGCPACGVRLVVEQSIAGTEGPCPSCGARIIAPPLEVAHSLVEKQAAPVVIRPRSISSPDTDPAPRPPAPAEGGRGGSPIPEPVSKPTERQRSVSPATIMLGRHTEKENTKVFVKMVIAAFLVVVTVLAVYFVITGAK